MMFDKNPRQYYTLFNKNPNQYCHINDKNPNQYLPKNNKNPNRKTRKLPYPAESYIFYHIPLKM